MSVPPAPTDDPSGSAPSATPAAAAAPGSAPAEPIVTGYCLNCSAPMYGPHCYNCGQPKKGLIRQFSSILGDFLDTVFSLDQRTLRTLIPLYFQPGFLTTEYFAGRRVRYVTPLRLYFFLSVIAFLIFSLVANPQINVGPNGIAIGSQYDPEALAKLDPEARTQRLAEFEKLLAAVPEAQRKEAIDELRKEVEREKKRIAKRREGKPEGTPDAPEDDAQISFNGQRWDPVTNPLRFDWLSEGMNQSLNAEIGEVVRKARSIKNDPAPLVKQVFSLAPQALFVILPLFALLLKLVYLLKRRLYMEHMIVALHSHSFICLSLIVIVALGKLQTWTADTGALADLFQWLLVAACVWVFLYLLLMQKRVYGQGWIMTVLKYGFVGLAYTVLVSFGMVATFIVSLIVL
jgi:hypothetical protein